MNEPYSPFTQHDAESLMGAPMPDDPDERAAWVRVLRWRLHEFMGVDEYVERSLLAGALPDCIFDDDQRRAMEESTRAKLLGLTALFGKVDGCLP